MILVFSRIPIREKTAFPKVGKNHEKSMLSYWGIHGIREFCFTYPHTWILAQLSILDEKIKNFLQFFPIPDAKHDPGNVPKEWRRFHESS